jgi:hypothetical protein
MYLGLELSGEALYVLGNLGLGRLFGARLTSGTGGLLLLWLAVAVLTLLPFALLRLLTWRRRGQWGQRGLWGQWGQQAHADSPASPDLSAASASSAPSGSVLPPPSRLT